MTIDSNRGSRILKILLGLSLSWLLFWGGAVWFFQADVRPSPPGSLRATVEPMFCRGQKDIVLLYVAQWDAGAEFRRAWLERFVVAGDLDGYRLVFRKCSDCSALFKNELEPMDTSYPAILVRRNGIWSVLPSISPHQPDVVLESILAIE